jgi:hypothetical protein
MGPTESAAARPLVVLPETDRTHHLADLTVHRGLLGQPRYLRVQVGALIMAGHPRLHDHANTACHRRGDIHEDRARR